VEVQEELAVEEEIVLPTGSLLITVGGIEIAQNAVGPALQLLEFCCAFSKVECNGQKMQRIVWSGLFYVPVLGLCGMVTIYSH
jgi:hypothetical protein